MAAGNAVSTADQTATARERADAIRRGIDATAAALTEVPRLVIEAYKADDWRALSYGSWPAYIDGEFGTSLLKLDKATRKQWTASFREHGMSTREISPVTNVSQMQVSRDVRETNVSASGGRPEEKLYEAMLAANKNLHVVLSMMRDGVQVSTAQQEKLRVTVELIKEIINIGEKREAP